MRLLFDCRLRVTDVTPCNVKSEKVFAMAVSEVLVNEKFTTSLLLVVSRIRVGSMLLAVKSRMLKPVRSNTLPPSTEKVMVVVFVSSNVIP